jgi:hypothetical protein
MSLEAHVDADERRKARAARFAALPSPSACRASTLAPLGSTAATSRASSALPVVAVPLIGTCMVVEKSFLRMTQTPLAEDIRPESVLKQALMLVKSAWRAGQSYEYCSDQLRSIRQDLTCQNCVSPFTVQVRLRVCMCSRMCFVVREETGVQADSKLWFVYISRESLVTGL